MAINGNEKPITRVMGVVRKKKEAKKYLEWLAPKDIENYSIIPSKRFVYVDVWQRNGDIMRRYVVWEKY